MPAHLGKRPALIKSLLPTVSFAIALVPIPTAPAVDGPPAFNIRLNRPCPLNQPVPVHCSAHGQAGSGDQLTKIDVDLIGTKTTTAIGPDGQETSYAITVNTCTSNGIDLAAKGDVLHVEQVPHNTARDLNGRPLNERQRFALYDLLSADDSGFYRDLDSRYGSSLPKKPGETWTLTADQLKRKLARFPYAPESLKGIATLKAVKTVAGVNAMLITVQIHADARPATVGQQNISSGSFDDQIDITVPVDKTRPELAVVEAFKFSLVSSGTDNDAGEQKRQSQLTSAFSTWPAEPAKPRQAK